MKILYVSLPELNVLVRTTVAFTQMRGSKAPNVIPPSASMVANMRLNPKDTVAGAVEYIRQTVADPDIELVVGDHMEPSPISRIDCEGWQRVANAVSATWPGSVISPYLMVQCSDSRHYRNLSDRVYRFSAMDLTRKYCNSHPSMTTAFTKSVWQATKFINTFYNV